MRSRMGLAKKVEIGFRKLLLKTLSRLVHRKKKGSREVNYNHCKFLFIRQDRIGDVLVSTPLFWLLKKYYPTAVIDVFLSSNNHFVLTNDPLVRKRWIYTKRFVSSLKTLMEIRSEHYDFVVDLMDNPSATSTVIGLLAHGKWNVGLKKENDYVYDIVVPMPSRRETHIVDRLAVLLEPFGIDGTQEDLRIRYTTSLTSRQCVSEFLKRQRGGKRRPYLGINISAGSDARFWGTRNYQEFIDSVRRREREFRILLLHKPADRDRAKDIAKPFPDVVVAPETTFDEFAAFIETVDILVTPDTSAVHLAAAFAVPSIVLYVQSDRSLRIWEPYKTDCETIVTSVDDLSAIPVKEVYQAFQRLAGRRSRRPVRKPRRLSEKV